MREKHIRPKTYPMINGGELETILNSWQIRVRPFTVNYPNGNVRFNNKSTIFDIGQYNVDVPGSYRWVVVYLDIDTLEVDIYGGIQEQNIVLSKPIDFKKHRLFDNKNLYVLGDLKITYGNKYMAQSDIDYQRRSMFMLSSTNYISNGTDITDHIQAWNDGDIVLGYDGIVNPHTKLRTTVLKFNNDSIEFVEEPFWEVGMEFSVSGSHTSSNDGYYKIIGKQDGKYTVTRRQIGTPAPIVADSTQGGIATLPKVRTMNTEYATTNGINHIKLKQIDCIIMNDTGIVRTTNTENMAFLKNGNIKTVVISNNENVSLPLRCQSNDFPSCGVPDTTGGEWSAFELNEQCSVFCESLCQTTCEELCQSNCESNCECNREQGTEEECQYVDYSGPIPHSLSHKCDATVEADNEIGSTCFVCDAACDTITACHTPPPVCVTCDSCDVAIENACLSCDHTCENHTGHRPGGGGTKPHSCNIPTYVIDENDYKGIKFKVKKEFSKYGTQSISVNCRAKVSLKNDSGSGSPYQIITATRTYYKDNNSKVIKVSAKYNVALGQAGNTIHISDSSGFGFKILQKNSGPSGVSRSIWENDGKNNDSRKQWFSVVEPSNLQGWSSTSNWSWSSEFHMCSFLYDEEMYTYNSYYKVENSMSASGLSFPITLKIETKGIKKISSPPDRNGVITKIFNSESELRNGIVIDYIVEYKSNGKCCDSNSLVGKINEFIGNNCVDNVIIKPDPVSFKISAYKGSYCGVNTVVIPFEQINLNCENNNNGGGCHLKDTPIEKCYTGNDVYYCQVRDIPVLMI